MGIGGPPGIWGEATRKALSSGQEAAAREHEASAERALLDAAELRELERSELYGGTPEVHVTPSRRRRLIDWLLRRSS
jgi:hypothetical protein